jgi:hypothetical protein
MLQLFLELEDQPVVLARRFIPRIESGQWTRDAVGLTEKFGVGFEDIDASFAESRALADQGDLHEARKKLYGLRRVDNHGVNRAVNHRVLQMLESFLQTEQRKMVDGPGIK